MPAYINPTELGSGEFANVRAGVAAEVLTLAGEYAWQVFHTGFTGGGVECIVPVWLRFNEVDIAFGPAKRAVLLPAGQVFTLPAGTTRLVFAVAVGSAEPILDLLSSKPGSQ